MRPVAIIAVLLAFMASGCSSSVPEESQEQREMKANSRKEHEDLRKGGKKPKVDDKK